MSRNVRERSMASTSAVSAYFGITEPAMFGINLRYKFPFYAALVGSAQHHVRDILDAAAHRAVRRIQNVEHPCKMPAL